MSLMDAVAPVPAPASGQRATYRALAGESRQALLAALHGRLPSGMRVELDTTTGKHVELGRVR